MIRLLYVFLRIGLMNEMAYRVNFYVQIVQSLVSLGTALAGLGLVYSHTEDLNGWQAPELLALLGIYLLSGGLIGLIIQPGMQQLMEDVRMGTLDYVITKPADAQVLVSFGQIRIWKITDVILGLAAVTVALIQLSITISPVQALGFAVVLTAGSAIIYSFWLILATLSFWFIRIENILHIFQSMYEAGRWPIGIYPGWLRGVLTFVVPVAFAVTVPAEALVGRLTSDSLYMAVGLAVGMLALSRAFFRFGLRSYSGASA